MLLDAGEVGVVDNAHGFDGGEGGDDMEALVEAVGLTTGFEGGGDGLGELGDGEGKGGDSGVEGSEDVAEEVG